MSQGGSGDLGGEGAEPAAGSSGGGSRQILRWTEKMEEAYEAALQQVGGLDAAKPKAIYEILAPAYPQLTLPNVKWHIQTHRKREEMRRNKPADYTAPTRWFGRLEEAYESEVARQGGLYAARPKALLEALQPEFPDLTLQIVKWHLQLQRRKDQQEKAKSGAGGALSGSTSGSQQQQQRQQQHKADSQSPAVSSQRAAAARQAPRSQGSGALPDGEPLLLARQRQQERQRQDTAQAVHQAQLLASLQRHLRGVPAGWLHAGGAPPWQPFLLPAAMDAARRCYLVRKRCTETVDALQLRVAELQQLVEVLKVAGPAGADAGDAPALSGSSGEQHLLGGLPPEVQQLLVQLLPGAVLHGGGDGGSYASGIGSHGWQAAAAAIRSGHARPLPATRPQRTLASLAASFPTVREADAAARWAL